MNEHPIQEESSPNKHQLGLNRQPCHRPTDLFQTPKLIVDIIRYHEHVHPSRMIFFLNKLPLHRQLEGHFVIPRKAPDPLESTSYATSLARGCYRPPEPRKVGRNLLFWSWNMTKGKKHDIVEPSCGHFADLFLPVSNSCSSRFSWGEMTQWIPPNSTRVGLTVDDPNPMRLMVVDFP